MGANALISSSHPVQAHHSAMLTWRDVGELRYLSTCKIRKQAIYADGDVPLCRCRTLGFWHWLDFYSGSFGWSWSPCFLRGSPSVSISAVRTVFALHATCALDSPSQ